MAPSGGSTWGRSGPPDLASCAVRDSRDQPRAQQNPQNRRHAFLRKYPQPGPAAIAPGPRSAWRHEEPVKSGVVTSRVRSGGGRVWPVRYGVGDRLSRWGFARCFDLEGDEHVPAGGEDVGVGPAHWLSTIYTGFWFVLLKCHWTLRCMIVLYWLTFFN